MYHIFYEKFNRNSSSLVCNIYTYSYIVLSVLYKCLTTYGGNRLNVILESKTTAVRRAYTRINIYNIY